MGQRAVLLPALLVIVGAVFFGQGTGVLRGSSLMVGDSRWAVIGGAMVIAGFVIGALALARSRR